CKILDFGKYKYEEQKKKNEARKKQKIIEVKESKLRPSIDDHDYDVKMRSMVKFIEEGDKVKVTMRFRGRELAHQELGMDGLVRARSARDARAGPRQHGARARARDHDQGADGAPPIPRAGWRELCPQPDGHARSRRLFLRGQPVARGL